MGCQSEVTIGDDLVFSITTHDPDTGVLTDADSAPSYRVYEKETGTAILTGSMAKLDDANTTGFYSEAITCSAGNGFEDGKSYLIYIEATVDSDKGGIAYAFKAVSEDVTDLNDFDPSSDTVDVGKINGTAVPETSGKLHVLDYEGNTVANEAKQDTIDSNVDAILVDT